MNSVGPLHAFLIQSKANIEIDCDMLRVNGSDWCKDRISAAIGISKHFGGSCVGISIRDTMSIYMLAFLAEVESIAIKNGGTLHYRKNNFNPNYSKVVISLRISRYG